MPLMRLDTPVVAAAQPGSGNVAAATAAAAAGGDGHPAIGVAKPAINADVGAVLIAYAAVIVGAAVGIVLWSVRSPAGFVPGHGISAFAPLYMLAQAIERFIEPFTTYLGAAATPAKDGKTATSKSDALEQVHDALAKSQATDAAEWQRVVDRIRHNTAVIAWALASFLGMALCGLFGLYMLRLIGFTGVPEQADIVISGLAIGSGTKPLHDLIANLQQSKTQKEDPPQRQAA